MVDSLPASIQTWCKSPGGSERNAGYCWFRRCATLALSVYWLYYPPPSSYSVIAKHIDRCRPLISPKLSVLLLETINTLFQVSTATALLYSRFNFEFHTYLVHSDYAKPFTQGIGRDSVR